MRKSHSVAQSGAIDQIGFTLIELLVVIAIIAIIAAILFPVFSQAREMARRSVCMSNLKQLGAAFAMYAADSDGYFPAPGGYEPACPVNGFHEQLVLSAWVLSSAPGLGNDIGGIYPYVRQRGNGGLGNLYGCPDAKPGVARIYGPGANYAMNDYLRMVHPGQASYPPRCEQMPGWSWGINPEAMGASPSRVILLFESAQYRAGNAYRNGSPFFSGGLSATPPLCVGMPQNYHAHKSHFLFCDTHVKALTPAATWSERDQYAFEYFNSRCAGLPEMLASGSDYRSGGEETMWDPQSANVAYP